MGSVQGWQILLIPIVVAAISFLVLLLISAPLRTSRSPLSTQTSSIYFLFRDELLVDMDAGQNTQSADLANLTTWVDLRSWLDGRFGNLPIDLGQFQRELPHTISAIPTDDQATLTITSDDNTHRITLSDPDFISPVARHQTNALARSYEAHHAALENAPCAICVTDSVGRFEWGNSLFDKFSPDEVRKILDITDHSTDAPISFGFGTGQDRQDFELRTVAALKQNFHYITDVSRAVQAETISREFVQTFTKTFANLTTGLAIFDRKRQLSLFNPALIDLTTLSAPFLSAQPDLFSFFDQLRDRHILPEPKNYPDWRSQINAMIQTATGGVYLENWFLPDGRTYRVMGRSHPDGAVAFLFENKTDDISLTRRFRAQLELRQSVLNHLQLAIAVFGTNGTLIFSNDRLAQVLKVDTEKFKDVTVRELLEICAQTFPKSNFWDDAFEAIRAKSLSKPIITTINEHETDIDCSLVPISNGETLLTLHPVSQQNTTRTLELST